MPVEPMTHSKRLYGGLKPTQRLALSGTLAALVFAATYWLHFQLPFMSGGYIHLGDGIILLSAALLGYAAAPAAALGSLLADVLLGWVAYAIPTFLIKGGMAVAAVIAMNRRRFFGKALGLVLAETLMVAGYFFVEWFVLGYGYAGAWVNVAGNALQGLSGVTLALTLEPALRQVKRPKDQ